MLSRQSPHYTVHVAMVKSDSQLWCSFDHQGAGRVRWESNSEWISLEIFASPELHQAAADSKALPPGFQCSADFDPA